MMMMMMMMLTTIMVVVMMMMMMMMTTTMMMMTMSTRVYVVTERSFFSETCNCFPKLFTNWWSNAPYVDNPLSLNKTGMLPTILRNVVKTCCGECGAHGRTVIDFKRTASDARAEKSGLVDFQTHIGEGAELSFPVYGFMHQKYYMDIYGFVPIVQSPGVALITIGDEEGTAAMVLIRSLALCWPILFLSVIMLWMFGVLMWFLVSPL